MDHALGVGGSLQEELDNGSKELQLHLSVLILEVLEERCQQLCNKPLTDDSIQHYMKKHTISIVDTLSVLSNDPNHGSLGLRLVKRLEVGAECGNDALVPVGVLSEDVLDDNDSLLDDVVHLGLDEIQQHLDATLGSLLELDGTTSNGSDRLPHELNINLSGILLELEENLLDVSL